MELPNGVKAKKSSVLFPGAKQGCDLMDKADTGALTASELLNVTADLRRKLCSAFRGSFALPVSGACGTTSLAWWQRQVLLQGFCCQCNTKHLSHVLSR